MADALYYRQQAQRFEHVADRCSIAELVPYYRKMAFDYLARAVQAEAAPEESPRRTSMPRKRAAQG